VSYFTTCKEARSLGIKAQDLVKPATYVWDGLPSNQNLAPLFTCKEFKEAGYSCTEASGLYRADPACGFGAFGIYPCVRSYGPPVVNGNRGESLSGPKGDQRSPYEWHHRPHPNPVAQIMSYNAYGKQTSGGTFVVYKGGGPCIPCKP